MSKSTLGMASLALACMIGAVNAQTTPPASGTSTATPAKVESTDKAKAPMEGANSFTEAQARDRIAEAGFADVKDLKKDGQGVWRAIAKKGDSQVNVALDFRGNVVQE